MLVWMNGGGLSGEEEALAEPVAEALASGCAPALASALALVPALASAVALALAAGCAVALADAAVLEAALLAEDADAEALDLPEAELAGGAPPSLHPASAAPASAVVNAMMAARPSRSVGSEGSTEAAARTAAQNGQADSWERTWRSQPGHRRRNMA